MIDAPQPVPASAQTPQPRIAAHAHIGSLTLAALTSDEAVRWIVDAACTGVPSIVVTPNIHHVRLAKADEVVRGVIERADLRVADGWPLVLASRMVGPARLPERVAGVDLVESVLRTAPRLRVAILGGAPNAAGALAERLGGRHDIVLVDPLPRGSWASDAAIEALTARVAAARPALTLVALGAPKQEFLAERLRAAVAGPIICCGAAVEMLGGVRSRAPRWLRRIGLEWAFRLALEPRRLGPRYLVAAISFVATIARQVRVERAH